MQNLTKDRAHLRALPTQIVVEPVMPAPAERSALADLPLPVIVGAYQSAALRLENAACGTARRPAGEDVHDTLILLRAGRVAVDRLQDERWVIVRDGLHHGATIADLADASGLGEVELALELGAWADRELEAGRMERDEHEQAITLLGTAVAVERMRLRRATGGAR